jgi:hypothetical protein
MTNDSTPRRDFLGQIAASAMVLAGAACAAPAAQVPASGPTPAGAPPSGSQATQWDDTWFARLTAKHKAVFDSPEIEDGLVLANASGYIRGMHDAAGADERDVHAVVVVRHHAVVMAFNDAMWQKYAIGKDKQIKTPRSEEWATRNPYVTGGGGRGGAAAADSPDRPQANFAWLASHGHTLLACDLATRNYANTIARNQKLEQRAVYDELKANLVSGFILQPTGVYAALRAQEAGCGYIRST